MTILTPTLRASAPTCSACATCQVTLKSSLDRQVLDLASVLKESQVGLLLSRCAAVAALARRVIHIVGRRQRSGLCPHRCPLERLLQQAQTLGFPGVIRLNKT
jgi:hypothetical protein